ncbi:restriction endonuclease [Nocardia terpenica]|uniref:restriction endonuclease n=1 Tax=Nocardia terpenica TaxID=455432 RepID=UPI002FE2C150
MRIARLASLATESTPTSNAPAVLHLSSVWPRKYRDKELRKEMGELIAEADADELLASFLWLSEGWIAREVADSLVANRESIQNGIDDIGARLKSPAPFGWVCEYTRREVTDLVNTYIGDGHRAIEVIRALEATVAAQIAHMRSSFGEDIRNMFTDTDADVGASASPIEIAWQAYQKTFPLVESYNANVACFDARLNELRTTERSRRAYVESRQGWTDRDLKRCDAAGFEKLTADLLHRDGMTILRYGGGSRDQGADVIAVTPDGRRVVVQCKLRQRGPIRPDVLYQVNGTARQVHNADIPVVVTNSTFSANATEFAADHAIYLIDDHAVRRWAIWGESFYDILQLEPEAAPRRPRAHGQRD